MTVHIHTDGSCHGNPGPGGWAAIILTETGENCTLRAGAPETTNNRMELNAIIQGLAQLQHMPGTLGEDIIVHTDSKYVVDAFMQGWIANWKRNGWRTAAKKAVLNQDLWQTLIPMVELRNVSWEWVKGHSGDYWNDLCDQIANDEAGLAAHELQPAEAAGDEDLAAEMNDHLRLEDVQARAGRIQERGEEYDLGWRDGYEAARKELMQLLQSMESRL